MRLMALRPLEGFVVAVTAGRRAEEQADLLERRGARVTLAPTIATGYLGSDEGLLRATRAVIALQPTHVVLTTGIGVRAWFEAAQSWELDAPLRAALAGATVLARGPKAAAAALTAGVDVDTSAPGERLLGLRGALADPGGGPVRVAIQCDGGGDDVPAVLRGEVPSDPSAVVTVPVYRWSLPADTEPARRLITDTVGGRVHAITFTAAPSVRNLFAIAEGEGKGAALVAALNDDVVAACVGPVCADAARAAGVRHPAAPETGRLGLLVRVLAERLERSRLAFTAAGTSCVVQGDIAVLDGSPVRLQSREARLLRALATRRGAVVSRPALRREVWNGEADDDHVVAVTVSRLRARLGAAACALVAVPRRGYRLAP